MSARGGRRDGQPLSMNPKAIRQRAYRAKNRERTRETSRAWYARNPNSYPCGWAHRLICTARSNSKRYKRELLIDKEYLESLWVKQRGRCHWSGVPMVLTRRSPWVVSADRLDNRLGYVPGNVVLTSWVMNRARAALTVEDFKEVLVTLSMSLSESRYWSAAE